MPRPPARYVERRLWNRYLLRTGHLTCLICGRVTRFEGDLSDPEVTARQGLFYKQYLKELTRAGIVSTPSGYHYKDEVEPYGPIPSGMISLGKRSKQ